MYNLTKPFILLICFLGMSAIAMAQLTEIDPTEDNVPGEDSQIENRSQNEDSRFVYGGFLWAGFGNVTNVNISPIVGYRVTDKFTPGIGVSYQFFRFKDPYNSPFTYDYKISTIGGKVFSQYQLFYGIFAHAEYEHLWYNLELLEDPFTSEKDQVPGLFVGGGYGLSAGRSGQFQIMALWNALWDPTNPIYANPWSFRFSIQF